MGSAGPHGWIRVRRLRLLSRAFPVLGPLVEVELRFGERASGTEMFLENNILGGIS